VPGLQALDAVSTATVEMEAQTPLDFYVGKEPALGYATGVPFGMNLAISILVEPAKNQLLRDFRRRSIFDFCNTIGTFRTCPPR
jgi:hypothetical protein